jgi:hypothetical protein
MKEQINILNQIFEIKQKLEQLGITEKFHRNFARIENEFETIGLIMVNPNGKKYKDTRTDLEASIAGKEGNNMLITNVIKPIIYHKKNGANELVQKGVVIVENK